MLCMPAPPDSVRGKKRFFMARCVFQFFCTLIIHLWLSLLITSNTPDNNTVCIPSIMVPRNTVWKARVMKKLAINCTVSSEPHCLNKVDASWCRINDKNACRPLNHSSYITTKWTNITESKKLLFLNFTNISMQDTGLYRCEIKSPTSIVSHSINVTVTDYVPDSDSHYVVNQENNATNSSNLIVEKGDEWLQTYMYIGIGIGALLLIVFVVSVTVIWCQAGQKISIKEQTPENQSTSTPMADLAPPVYNPSESSQRKTQTLPAQLSPPPPCIYDTPPVRVTSLRERSSGGRHPVNQRPPRRSNDRGTVEEEEEENPLIYASLNHEVQPQRPVRVAHVQIEASEYAAIKIT